MSAINYNKINAVALTSAYTVADAKRTNKTEKNTNEKALKILCENLISNIKNNNYGTNKNLENIYPKFVKLIREETDTELTEKIGTILDLIEKKLDPKTISTLLQKINSK